MTELRIGKAEQAVLKNTVFNRIRNARPETLSVLDEACDAARLRTGGETIVSTGVASENVRDICFYAFYRALNNAAAAQAEPLAVLTEILMPEGSDREFLKECTDRFVMLGRAEHVDITGGHSEVSFSVKSPVLSVVCIGRPLPGRTAQENGAAAGLICGRGCDPAKPLSILMTKYAGLEGTAILACEKEEELRKRFPRSFIDAAKELKSFVPSVADARLAVQAAPVILHDASKGGVLSALWDLSAAYGCGLEIDMRAIPLRQETVEICEYFDVNPYELLSGGSMLILTDDAKAVKGQLENNGIKTTVIGAINGGSKKILRNAERCGCMNRPSADALYFALRS